MVGTPTASPELDQRAGMLDVHVLDLLRGPQWYFRRVTAVVWRDSDGNSAGVPADSLGPY